MNTDILHLGVASVPAETPITDHQLPLLEAFRTHGDREALNALFTTLGPTALALAFRRLADVTAAEDVVQEACLDLISGCRSYQSGRGTIKAWFMGMVLNRCRMYERSKERRQRHEGAVPPPTPSTTLPDSDLIEAVRLAVQELPEHERSTIELRFLIGLECKDVAATLGRPEKTIRSQVDRALVRLKDILLKKGIGPVEAGTVSGAMVLPMIPISEEFAQRLATTAKEASVPSAVFGTAFVLAGIGILVGIGVVWLSGFFPIGEKERKYVEVPIFPVHFYEESPTGATKSEIITGLRIIGNGPFQAPGSIESLTFSPDSRQLAAGGDGFLVWDLKTGMEVYRNPLPESVHVLTWRSQTEIAYVNAQKEVIVRDIAGNREIRRISTTTSINDCNSYDAHFDPTGRWLVVPASRNPIVRNGRLSYQNPDCGLALIDLETGEYRVVASDLVQRKTPLGMIKGGMRSPDGTRIAFVENGNPIRLGIVDSLKGTLLASWNLPGSDQSTGMQIRWSDADSVSIQLPACAWRSNTTFRVKIGSPRVEKEDGCLIVNQKGHTIGLYKGDQILTEVCSGAEVETLFRIPKNWHPWSFGASPDGNWIAIQDRLFAQPAIANISERRWVTPTENVGSKRPESIQWMDDGSLVLGTSDGMTVYSSDGSVWKGEDRMIICGLGIPTIGSRIITHGGTSGQPIFWDATRHQKIGAVSQGLGSGINFLSVSPSGQHLVFGGGITGRAIFQDLRNNTRVGSVEGIPDIWGKGSMRLLGWNGFAWSKDGSTVYISDNTLDNFAWNLRKSRKMTDPIAMSGAWDPCTGRQRFCFRDQQGKPIELMKYLVLSPDEKSVFLQPGHWQKNDKEFELPPIGLYSALDGSFQCTIDDPGTKGGFTPDGSLCLARVKSGLH